jgi:ABC-type dipeptide/oligopeptide/nickel transport system permease component
MLRFIAIRLLQFPLILGVIYVVTFTLAWIAPGSPFDRTERQLSPQAKQALKERFHAEHWYSFLAYYPARIIVDGDFGPRLSDDVFTVNDTLKRGLPVSATLGLIAITIAAVGGIFVGTLAAVRRGGALDILSLTISLVGISIPSFVVAALLKALFTRQFPVLPVDGWGSPGHIILPALALSLAPMAYISRLTRVSMIDVLSADYVRTARAKGVSRQKVIWKHCLRNAFLPVLSFLGPATAATMTGSFVVETIFSIPGIGESFVNGVLNRDQTLILGTVMVYSLFLLTLNLIVDVCYALVDPRIEVGAKTPT